MSTFQIDSLQSLQEFFGAVRDMWNSHHFLRITLKTGKDRTADQNSISHAWYVQLARECREYDALGWKSFCKLHFGVGILRAEDAEFRAFYDKAIKFSLSYEEKIKAMEFVPCTSLMTTLQLSKYLEAMQAHFLKQGVMLEFPKEDDKPRKVRAKPELRAVA